MALKNLRRAWVVREDRPEVRSQECVHAVHAVRAGLFILFSCATELVRDSIK